MATRNKIKPLYRFRIEGKSPEHEDAYQWRIETPDGELYARGFKRERLEAVEAELNKICQRLSGIKRGWCSMDLSGRSKSG